MSADKSEELRNVLARFYEQGLFGKSPSALTIFLRGEIKVLTFICRKGCELSTGEIASSLDMTGGRLTAVLQSLEKKGYITRRADEKDKRRSLISVTDSGKAVVKKGTDDLDLHLKKLIAIMGSEQTSELIHALNCFANASDILYKEDN